VITGLRHSFRGRLALRFGLTVIAVAATGSSLGYLALRNLLFRQLDRTLLQLAAIEASAASGSHDSSVHFHDEVFLTVGSGTEVILPRFAEVWSVSGRAVIRTRNLGTRDLPMPAEVHERVVASGDPEIFDLRWNGDSYRAVLYPLGLVGPQHQLHLLQVVVSAERTREVLFSFLGLSSILAVVGTGVSFALGWWIAGSAIRPVMETIRQAESIEMTKAHHRIEATADSEEMRRLVSVLNSMLARIDAAFEAQRRFLADVGHEIRTPLTVLRGDVEVALRKPRSADEYEEILSQSLEDLKGVSALADDLITLARGESGALAPESRPVDATALLRKVEEKYRSAAESARVVLEVKDEQPAVVAGDRRLLERAVSNLVDNAIKYGASGGRITLRARADDTGEVTLAVSDRGPGIQAEEQSRLFERFVRGESGRRKARGSGLGLSIVRAITESHGGTVAVRSAEGEGATFEMRFPG